MDFSKFQSFADGKKTYAIVAVGLIMGILQGLHDYHIIAFQVPSYVDWGLGFIGLGAARMGIQNQAKNTTENIVALVQDIVSQIQAPPQPSPVDSPAVTADLNKAQLK